MRFAVDTLALAYAYVSHVAPDGVAVQTVAQTDTVDAIPVAIVSASSPQPVGNDPEGTSSAFTLAVSVYASDRDDASAICDAIYGGILRAHRAAYVTPHGWIASIPLSQTIQPQRVASDLGADDLSRFDCVLPVVARH